jgi:hypothetical protein
MTWTHQDARELARAGEEARRSAWAARGDGHPLGDQLVRRANQLIVRGELALLAAQGDREAQQLLERGT